MVAEALEATIFLFFTTRQKFFESPLRRRGI